jgi:hypothetical protein
MSNFNAASDFAAYYRMYKQFESANQRLEGIQPQPQPSVGPQQPITQVQRPTAQRLSPARFQPQSYQQSLRNAPELLSFFRTIDEVKKRLGDISAALNSLQNM